MPLQTDGEIDGDGRFSHAAFACADGNDVFDLRKQIFSRLHRAAGVGGEFDVNSLSANPFDGLFDVSLDGFLQRAGRCGQLDMNVHVRAVYFDILHHVEGDDVLEELGVLDGS